LQQPIQSLPRRQILIGSAAALASIGLATWSRGAFAAGAKPLPDYVNWKDPGSVIVHSSRTLETKRSAYGNGVITPADQLFVRNNLPTPDASIVANRDAWQISIEGVKNPRTLTLADLKAIGIETTAMVLQCSGNGRAFFKHKPSGTQWGVGAAGCVVWTGVPVRWIVDALGGLADGARYMTGTGGEKLPEGVDSKSVIVERSLPLDAGAMDDALLAWELNSEELPLAHGGPLRLIVPGYTGVNNVKYVKRLAFTAQESDAKIMTSGYRLRPIGVKGAPDQPSAQKMSVKSWITAPVPEDGTLKAGVVQIVGVAFGGVKALAKVEVSMDGGKTWNDARLIGPDLGKYAWRQFAFAARLPQGKFTLASKATDVEGNVQPEQRYENHRGYNNTSWVDHAVKVIVA